MEEELGGTFVVSVDELGLNGLWSTIKDVSVLLLYLRSCCLIMHPLQLQSCLVSSTCVADSQFQQWDCQMCACS
jgi:hypothetical protein